MVSFNNNIKCAGVKYILFWYLILKVRFFSIHNAAGMIYIYCTA